jgi:hypothetical protein
MAKFRFAALSTAIALCLPAIHVGADDAVSSIVAPPPVRISPSQYEQSVADIFGTSINVTGRFEPEVRDEGLMALGDRKASITDTGLERYDDLARAIAAQVVNEKHRSALISCRPRDPKAADDACTRVFVTTVGRLVYRRALKDSEIDRKVRAAAQAANTLHDFYAGISATVADMLISPNFLFRQRNIEPDPAQPGSYRLDGYAKASTLAAFLWNTAPDDLLLKAAESGDIHTKAGLKKQVDRMVSAPSSIEGGVRAFFSDMLGFSDFETLSKDPNFFPRYTLKVRDQSEEQTLRTIVDHVVKRQGDYRDLYTTPNTFLTRSLAALYDVPLIELVDNGQPERWIPYTYPAGDPRAGILAQASFVALHSPAGRTSPTARGKALRENILCQPVPPPPGNVDFKFVQDTSNPVYKTTRDRLTAHRSEAMCAGCHKITDPIGLALENFDSSGAFRTEENGVVIDTTGDLSGVKFTGPVGLAKAIHDDPALTSCVAKRVFAYGAGRSPAADDPQFLRIERKFAESRYNVLELMREVAMSDALYAVPAQKSP